MLSRCRRLVIAKSYAASILIMFATGMVSAQQTVESTGPKPVDLPKDMKPVYTSPDRIAEDLKAHGIGMSEEELIKFLEQGLAKTTNLPERPVEKSQLIIDTMATLAQKRSRAAVPIIARIARFDRTVGAFKIVEYDVAKTSPQAREDFRVRAYRLVQFNAINALGLIGDPSSAELIRTILQQEKTAGAQIQYSLCLASLGDPTGLDYLINLISLKNRRESAAAAKAFYYVTGQDFGYTENSPVRVRNSLPARYSEWWRQNRNNFQVNAEAVRQRRLNPPSPQAYAPRSTRDLLKLAANYFDFNNTMGSADARKALLSAGSSLNADFKKIASDVMEDIDVRMEALNWYFEANRSDPLDFVKSLRRDENPEVADKANTILDQIAEETQPRVRQ